MKSITLQTAVMLAVNELLALGGFSAYEVTKLIRLKVDHEYYLSDVDERDVNFNDPSAGSSFTVVEHEAVRDLVVELYQEGLFKANKGYNTNGTSQWVIYTPIDAVVPAADPIPNIVNLDPLLDKINAYLSDKKSATIKQIQSALKVKGVTCADILDAVLLYDKYNTVYNTGKPSTTEVVW